MAIATPRVDSQSPPGLHSARTRGPSRNSGDENMSTGADADPRPTAARTAPRAFKVIDVATGAVLAENADARATVDVLTPIDSMFDVAVYVWHPPARAWRQLTVGEHRTLWSFRGR